MYVRGAYGHFFWNVAAPHRLTNDLVAREWLRLDARGRFAPEIYVLRQLPVAGFGAACSHCTVADRELISANAKARSRKLQQHIARFRRRIAQRGAALLDRLAARGHALVGTARGIG